MQGLTSQPKETLRRAAMTTAVVAAVFTLAVGALMIVEQSRGKVHRWVKGSPITDLKVKLRENPVDEKLKQQIRALDLQRRRELFARLEFSAAGAWLLILGGLAFALSARAAVASRLVLPDPKQWGPRAADEEAQAARRARFAIVGGWGLLAVAGVVLLRTTFVFPWGEMLKAGAQQAQPWPAWEEMTQQWPSFRGADGSGVTTLAHVATNWDAKTGHNIAWKTAVPLPGNGSPVVWKNRVFLSGASKSQREIFCFDTRTGALAWQRPIQTPASAAGGSLDISEDTSFAASTPVTDGRRVYAIFANGDVGAVNVDGRPAWAVNLGLPDNHYGYATSLAIYQDRLLVLYDQGKADDKKSKLIALNARTGEKLYEKPRPVDASWASPVVVQIGSVMQLITMAEPRVIAYDPVTGNELWHAEGVEGEVAPSPVAAAGFVYFVNPSNELIAMHADGARRGQVAWKAEDGIPDICSPVTDGQRLLLLTSDGLLTCYDAKTGKKARTKDMMTEFLSSPSLVGGRVYVFSRAGKGFVFDDQLAQVGGGELNEKIAASPAFAEGRMYVRSEKSIFCIAPK